MLKKFSLLFCIILSVIICCLCSCDVVVDSCMQNCENNTAKLVCVPVYISYADLDFKVEIKNDILIINNQEVGKLNQSNMLDLNWNDLQTYSLHPNFEISIDEIKGVNSGKIVEDLKDVTYASQIAIIKLNGKSFMIYVVENSVFKIFELV